MSDQEKTITSETKPKKTYHRRFFTVKRIILLTILVLLITYVLVYFLGGYKAVAVTSDVRPFTEEGFQPYESFFKVKEAEVNEHNTAFDEKLNKITDEAEFVSRLDELIADVWTKNNAESLKRRVNMVDNAVISSTEKDTLRNTIDAKGVTNYEYARKLLDEFEKVFENDQFVFYFNKSSTQFYIQAVKRNSDNEIIEVLNTWYSNPQNGGVDEYARGGSSTINLQQSPVLISYFTRSGSVNQLTSYEYAIADRLGSGDDMEYVTPSFSIKINEQDKSMQIYYTFEKKGIKYYDFPKYLTDDRLNELLDLNQLYVDEQINELKQYYEAGNLKGLQTYIDAHKDVSLIKNYTPLVVSDYREIVGVIAYNSMMKDEGQTSKVNANNYATIINQLEHDEEQIEYVYKLACEMVRVEYKVDYTPSSLGKKISDTAYLRNTYGTYFDTEAAIKEGFDIGCGYRRCDNYTSMKKVMRDNLNQILYSRLRYTQDDLEQDQEQFNVELDSVASVYRVAVEYRLTDNGLTTTVLTDSIKETNSYEYPICRVDVLPYFTSSCFEVEYDGEKYETSGTMIIPDGSGAIIDFNNGKIDYSQYSKKIYTTDLAFGSVVKVNEQEDILLPMYAIISNRIMNTLGDQVVQNGYAIIARITKGAAQMSLNANVSKNFDSYNRTYLTIVLRESQTVKIGTGYYAKDITKFTEKVSPTDYVIEYNIKTNETTEDYTYSDVAKMYQQMLLDDGVLSKDVVDTTDDTVVNVELIGVYDYKDNFLGIVYSGRDTLTTYNQAVEIVGTLKEWGAEKINLMYLGWRKGGLINESFKNMRFSSKLGSKKEYKNLLNTLKEDDITLYPVTSFMEINKYQDLFGKNRYSTRDISSEYTVKYPYDLASNVYDKKANAYYTLSPKFYQKFAEILSTNFKKANPELEAMAFNKLGGAIASDYKKREQYFKYNSVLEQINTFEILQKNGITKLSLNAPYEYAVTYASNITSLPYQSTLKEVFNYSIPLYQLIFSGYRDYSGLVINANDEKSIVSHLMDIFATGSNVEFTFTYDNSSKLIQTSYNYYYYTQYSQWENEVKSILNELDKYQLHKYVLAKHEQYQGHSGVYVVTYANKADMLANGTSTDTFKVYLNYSDKAVENVATHNGNITLSRWSYYVDKEVA